MKFSEVATRMKDESSDLERLLGYVKAEQPIEIISESEPSHLQAFSFDSVKINPHHFNRVRFTTNGSQGGDRGHGGKASIEFDGSVSPFELEVKTSSGKSYRFREVDFVKLETFGDLEIEGIAFALIELGKALMKDGIETTTK